MAELEALIVFVATDNSSFARNILIDWSTGTTARAEPRAETWGMAMNYGTLPNNAWTLTWVSSRPLRIVMLWTD